MALGLSAETITVQIYNYTAPFVQKLFRLELWKIFFFCLLVHNCDIFIKDKAYQYSYKVQLNDM